MKSTPGSHATMNAAADETEDFQVCGNEFTRIATGAGTSFAGRIMGGALQFLYTVIVVRFLGAQSFGLFMLGLTIISFVGVLGRLGLEPGLVKFVSAYRGVGDKQRVKGVIVLAMGYSLLASILVGIVLFLMGDPVIARFFDKPQLGGIIKYLAPSLPFLSLMLVALSATQGFQTMKYTVYGQNLFWPVANIALVLLFFLLGFELYGVVAAHVLSVALAAILAVYFVRKCFPDLIQTKAVWDPVQLFRYSVPLLAVVFVYSLLLWTDTLMLGFFRSPEEVGIYNAAMRTALLISLILASFNSIFAPVISDLHNRQEMVKLGRLFKSVTRWVFGISLPVCLLMAFLSEDIMGIFGQEFLSGRVPLLILAFAQMVNAGVGSVAVLLAMSGRQSLVLKHTLLAGLLNLILNWVLIPPFGIVGAAVATATSIITVNVVMLGSVWVLYRIHPYNRQYYKGFLAAVASFGVLFIVNQFLPEMSGVQRILVYSPLFLALCAGFIFGLGFDVEDRFIFNMLAKKLSRKTAGGTPVER